MWFQLLSNYSQGHFQGHIPAILGASIATWELKPNRPECDLESDLEGYLLKTFKVKVEHVLPTENQLHLR